ncbi:MAG: hypothetical protein JWM57_328 [Phycisphaerales bacterium]|nr:hypothetical protein [Phycisphaerales bacterium]
MSLQSPRHRFWVRCLTAVVLTSAALVATGCTALGAVAYKLSQEQSIPAKYILNKDVPTVVLVENYRTPDLMANDAELLARCLQDKLDEKKVAKIVKTEKIFDLRNNKPKEFAKMAIPEIAKAVGAEQVIYVDLQGGGIGSLAGGQSMFQGKAYVSIKVIDAKTGASLYPNDSVDGLPLNYETSAAKGREEGSYASVRTELYDGMAKTIGRQFYPWKASEDEDQ